MAHPVRVQSPRPSYSPKAIQISSENVTETGRPWQALLDHKDGSDRKPVLFRVRGVWSYKKVPRNRFRYHNRVVTTRTIFARKSQARPSDFFHFVIMYKCTALLVLLVACVACVAAAPAPGYLASAPAVAYSAHPASVVHAAAPFAYAAHAAPVAYAAHAAPLAYSAPLAYTAHSAHLAYAAPAVSYVH